MSRFFRENFHKITLLLTAVFWANCGAAEEKQDIPQKEPVKDSIKTAAKKIEIVEFYYGVIQPNDDASIEVIDENKSLTSEDVRDAVSIYAKGYLDIPSMKK